MIRKRFFQMLGLGGLGAAGYDTTPTEAALITYVAPPRVRRPALLAPVIIRLTATSTMPKMDNSKDYIIVLPTNGPRTNGVRLVGGRNRALIGGYLSTSAGLTMPNVTIGDGAIGGITICEGLLFDGAHGGLSDAFHIQAPNTHVRLKMNRVDELNGSFSTIHADVIQNLGCLSLQVEDLTGRSHYNNGYCRRENDPLGNAIGRSTWNRVNMGGYKTNPDAVGTDPKHTLRALSLGTQPAPKAGDPTDPINGLLTGSVWLYDYWDNLPEEAGVSADQSVWPHAGSRMVASARAQLSADGKTIDWPGWRTSNYPPAGETVPSTPGNLGSGDAKVYGVVNIGPPPGGDFVTPGDVGLAYPRLA
jgi:hypothetical protein